MPRRAFLGEVVSCKMQKTAVIQVKKAVKHPLYKKITFEKRKYMAHDPESICKVGDIVKIIESRPHSKRKQWEILSVESKKEEIEAEDASEIDKRLKQ